jgi:hypothetical protein
MVVTASDLVVKVDPTTGDCQPVFSTSVNSKTQDGHQHLNSLVSHGGTIYVSGFGPRKDRYWSSTGSNGFVQDVLTGEVIAAGFVHPHSLFAQGGRLLLCESHTKTIRDLDGGSVWSGTGYLRGVANVDDETVLVAQSQGRVIESRPDEVANRAGYSVGSSYFN